MFATTGMVLMMLGAYMALKKAPGEKQPETMSVMERLAYTPPISPTNVWGVVFILLGLASFILSVLIWTWTHLP
jgi:hypothetical protein